MAKMTRDALKTIVKECLVEIFTEMKDPLPQKNSSSNRKRIAEERRLKRMRQELDSRSIQEQDNLRIEQTVGQVTNDPLLSMILADTASTTLVEQMDAEGHGPNSTIGGGAGAIAAAQGDPMDMFGEVADNWATLAFAEKKKM